MPFVTKKEKKGFPDRVGIVPKYVVGSSTSLILASLGQHRTSLFCSCQGSKQLLGSLHTEHLPSLMDNIKYIDSNMGIIPRWDYWDKGNFSGNGSAANWCQHKDLQEDNTNEQTFLWQTPFLSCDRLVTRCCQRSLQELQFAFLAISFQFVGQTPFPTVHLYPWLPFCTNFIRETHLLNWKYEKSEDLC